jgi:hypothetical protein
MNFIRSGIDPDPITVEVRMKALAAEGFTAANFGITEQQLRHHLDPRTEPELWELFKINPKKMAALRVYLSPEHKEAAQKLLGNGRADKASFTYVPQEGAKKAPAIDSGQVVARPKSSFGNGGASYREGSPDQIILPPPPDRASLTLSAWLDRDIPERDFLLGNVMCTTSRWFVIGETGIGKTLFGGSIGGAVAKGAAFLNWEARRPSRVMYLDGELPVETFKERMQLIASRYGRDIPFFGYNREDLGLDGMPPLNTQAGQVWLRREIEAIKPDLFDSIMCLLVGSMLEEATWAPMKPLVCELSARHIAQVWFNHANDLGKSFGDKTREWEMDTVAKLAKVDGDETAIRLEFSKARLRTPKTAGQFSPLIIRPTDDWSYEIAKGTGSGRKAGGDVEMVRDELVKVYDDLAGSEPKTLGLDGRSTVLKVSTAVIRDELKNRGFLDRDDNGAISRVSRNHFSRAKKELLRRGTFAERKDQLWRL